MCGIIGYLGTREAYPLLIKGLKRLEYRGYDSAGIAVLNGSLSVYKKMGKVAVLEHYASGEKVDGNIGIGHTRWATHGIPSDLNSHPHLSNSGRLAIIHNGIIENYEVLRTELMAEGYVFHSDTDTEVLVNYFESVLLAEPNRAISEVISIALRRVTGSYAIVVLDHQNPDILIAARKGSPIVIGKGAGEFFISSDVNAIVEHTRDIIYPMDGDVIALTKNTIMVRNLEGGQWYVPEIKVVTNAVEELEKGGYASFMLKEINDQPVSIANCLAGRIDINGSRVVLPELDLFFPDINAVKRIIFVACGTSYHASLYAGYLIESMAGIRVQAEYASEFRYRDPVIDGSDLVVAISQSGETADTIAAVELAKQRGAGILSLCNVAGSSIPRLSSATIYLQAGPEIGVASTKAFTTQVTAVLLTTIYLADKKGKLTEERRKELLGGLQAVPELVRQAFALNDQVAAVAKRIKDAPTILFLGRGIGFPVALEGALKLKELSYIHAEGHPAAEMKHGPIALIDAHTPVVFIATQGPLYEKLLSNMQEVKARKGIIIAIVSTGDVRAKELADHCIEIPAVEEALLPIVAAVPLQLLAYHTASLLGHDVDQPRNLAKSVTVE